MVIHRILARLVTTTNMITLFFFFLSLFFLASSFSAAFVAQRFVSYCWVYLRCWHGSDAKVGGPQIPIKARVVVGLKHQFAGARGFFLWIGRY
jgi:hypothetical protein